MEFYEPVTDGSNLNDLRSLMRSMGGNDENHEGRANDRQYIFRQI